MPIRSMTGFAQVKAQVAGDVAITLSLKSVNHRYLDLHLRLPGDMDELELKLRRILKEKIARGHVELTLNVERAAGTSFKIDRSLVGGYVEAFRTAAKDFGLTAEPDLNVILRMPGAMTAGIAELDGDFSEHVLNNLDAAVAKLNVMREEEGKGIERELRDRLHRLQEATNEIEKLRGAVSKAYLHKVQARIQELIGARADQDRILQEAALLAERSDIQEEIVRMHTHLKHFAAMLSESAEVGKKLDFLLQEMNREANTLLSKTAGVSGEGLRITELGLAMKSEIEKLREQVQNIE